MVLDAIEQGKLRPGMTIVEGTAGNTGIGLAMIAKALGYRMLVVMPNDQAREKMDLVRMYGAQLLLVDSVPFTDENHFFHTASRIAREKPNEYWHANQFENLSNLRAHYSCTGPEIVQQLEEIVSKEKNNNGRDNGSSDDNNGNDSQLDVILVSAAGTGGTLAGCSKYLKETLGDKRARTVLVDPSGSGLAHFAKFGEFVKDPNEQPTFTEGVGIMRLVSNFNEGRKYLDEAFRISDAHVVRMAQYVRDHDGITPGSSAALNLCGALRKAVGLRNQNKNIVTFLCDGGERTLSKMYNDEFLKSRQLSEEYLPSIEQMMAQYEELERTENTATMKIES